VTDPIPEPAGRWHALGWIAAAQVGAMSTWFSAAAVAPSLQRDWHLSSAQLALLTVGVQLGFVTGGLVSAVSGVADLLSTRHVFVASALAAALANALLVVAGGSLWVAVLTRFSLGFFLAGVYPTGMKLMAGWFRAGRGLDGLHRCESSVFHQGLDFMMHARPRHRPTGSIISRQHLSSGPGIHANKARKVLVTLEASLPLGRSHVVQFPIDPEFL